MKPKSKISSVLVVGLSLIPQLLEARSHPVKQGEHWVATWAVAQQLMPGTLPGQSSGRPTPRSSAPEGQVTSSIGSQPAVSAPTQATPSRFPRPSFPAKFENQTVRMIVHATLGGQRVRVELSNMFDTQPVKVGVAHIAVHKGSGNTVPGTDRALTFGGNPSVLLQPGTAVLTDAAELDVPAGSELAISLYLPRDTGPPSLHMQARQTVAYIAAGNGTASEVLEGTTPASYYAWLSSVHVIAPANDYAVVALGDSITDSLTSWAPFLAGRLGANTVTRNIAVVNAGIAGNQVLRDGAGISALARFDRDVLSRPGAKWIVLLEGVNDIQLRGKEDGPDALTADELIGGYKQIIERAHLKGMRVVGATITGYMGVRLASERGEQIRQDANRWIRGKGNFDAVVDFDAAVKDPNRAGWLKSEFDSGDHIHPNEAGQRAMANAFDLALFRQH